MSFFVKVEECSNIRSYQNALALKIADNLRRFSIMSVWILFIVGYKKVLLCFQRHCYYCCANESNCIKITWSPVSFLGIHYCSASLFEIHKNTISLTEISPGFVSAWWKWDSGFHCNYVISFNRWRSFPVGEYLSGITAACDIKAPSSPSTWLGHLCLTLWPVPEYPDHYVKANCRKATKPSVSVLAHVVCVMQNHWASDVLPLVEVFGCMPVQPLCWGADQLDWSVGRINSLLLLRLLSC